MNSFFLTKKKIRVCTPRGAFFFIFCVFCFLLRLVYLTIFYLFNSLFFFCIFAFFPPHFSSSLFTEEQHTNDTQTQMCNKKCKTKKRKKASAIEYIPYLPTKVGGCLGDCRHNNEQKQNKTKQNNKKTQQHILVFDIVCQNRCPLTIGGFVAIREKKNLPTAIFFFFFQCLRLPMNGEAFALFNFSFCL